MAVMKQIATAANLYTHEPMAAVSETGASPHPGDTWHDIEWRKVHQNVRRLQARIVQATKAGRWGKVKALQRLLTHSFSGKALAVKRVTENQGKRTPGVDGQTWSTPAAKTAAIGTLRQHGYRAQPLRRVYIPKANGQQRPLGIPTMKDRAMQALYLLALDPIAETTADPDSYGFRQKRSTQDAIGQCFLLLAKQDRATWILEGDIRACFDHISHTWLEEHIPIDKKVLNQWLKAGYLEHKQFYPTTSGTPQGGIISPTLMNMALDGLEGAVKKGLGKGKGLQRGYKVNVVRYADDFIITAATQEILEEVVRPRLTAFLQTRGLTLSEEKTRITHIEEGFDFLGFHLRKYAGTSLIKPSKSSIQKLLDKIRRFLKANRHLPPHILIAHLNPLIKGWANYYRHQASSKTFAYVDHRIFQLIWRWVKRRHPHKNGRWLRKHYFTHHRGNNWSFFGYIPSQPKSNKVFLTRAARISIKRHLKIQKSANPYDPDWEAYFEQRLETQLRDDITFHHSLYTLWKKQKGICPLCRQEINPETGWNNHHVVWRVFGGSDSLDNRVLLHPNCHRQLHSRGLSVSKPLPPSGDVCQA